MDELNVIVMGKTGAGKSTLVNAILGENVAPTGSGQPVTKENKIYSANIVFPQEKNKGFLRRCGRVEKHINLYDTVGLEIDSAITEETLAETKQFVRQAQASEKTNDITLVWFCVNYRSSRFEPYEINLIRKLAVDYEIPFMIVITQCYTDEPSDLEIQIKNDFPEMPVARVLAKDYKTRAGRVEAKGLTELLQSSIQGYDTRKVKLLEEKLIFLSQDRERIIEELKENGKKCIESYADKALKIGIVPGGCIPIVHGMCIKMIMELNKIVGLDSTEDYATDIFVNAMLGIVATPFMAIPVLSAFVASAYVDVVGEYYLDALMGVVEKSTSSELKNNALMAMRIKAEIQKRKK